MVQATTVDWMGDASEIPCPRDGYSWDQQMATGCPCLWDHMLAMGERHGHPYIGVRRVEGHFLVSFRSTQGNILAEGTGDGIGDALVDLENGVGLDQEERAS